MSSHTKRRDGHITEDYFVNGGEMGARMRAFDWSRSPIGPVDKWPHSLRAGVNMLLNSAFPMFIWWGKDAISLYNDAYIPFLGKAKHPQWLGRSARGAWQEIWDVVGPLFDSVLETGKATWSEDLLLLMDRHIPIEETYYTFSYSPVLNDEGEIGGVFCACTETTGRVIGERRLRTLRDLGPQVAVAKSAEQACEMAAYTLESNTLDVPFSLIYLVDAEERQARLAATSNLKPGDAPAPQFVSLTEDEQSTGTWPLATVWRSGNIERVDDIIERFGPLPGGPWPESPHTAFILPLAAVGQDRLVGFMVAGVSPRRILDDEYRGFLSLAAGHVATAIGNAQAYEQERKRADALAELDRAKTTFFSNVSHEFRTPLTLMLGPIEDMLAEEDRLSDEQRQRLEVAQRNALRLLKLVNGLLDFSRIEAGRIQAVYVPTDLASLTAELASSFRSAIEKAGMEFVVDCPPLPEPVYVDHEMWEKIVLNLLSNAFKYTVEGRITVALRLRDRAVELSVRDTGVGIPEQELPRIFERFHRVQGSEGRTYEGTGIGLSLVQELVKLHGGTIEVQSVYRTGSTFTVSVPLGKAHLPAEKIVAKQTFTPTTVTVRPYIEEALRWLPNHDPKEALDIVPDLPMVPYATPRGRFAPGDGSWVIGDGPKRTPTPIRQSGHKNAQHTRTAKILFVDDNADMREYVSHLLGSRYEVRAAIDGAAALGAVSSFEPDLVLTDVMMPRMDGFELLKALKNDPKTSSIPVIMLSARAGEEARVEGVEAGADDYLAKPFSARELLARVAAHLEMARLRREVETERTRLRLTFMQIPVAITVLRGPDLVYDLVNPTALKMVAGRQILGKPLRKAFPELPEEVLNAYRQVLKTGEPFTAKGFPVVLDWDNNGRPYTRYWDIECEPMRGEGGDVEGIIAAAADVTDARRAAEKIRESEEHLRAMFDSTAVGFATLTPEARFLQVNDAFCGITGYSRQELLEMNCASLAHPDDLASIQANIELLVAGKIPSFILEKRYIKKGGETIWIQDSVSPVHDAEGKPLYLVAICQDVTERRKLEARKDHFIALASHELKTPITSLKMSAQLLNRRLQHGGLPTNGSVPGSSEPNDGFVAKQLTRMDEQLNKLTELVNDLLDVSKIEAGKLEYRMEEVDLAELIRDWAQELGSLYEKHSIVLNSLDSGTIIGDRDRIGQVLTNLITNAIKFSPVADQIIVGSRVQRGEIRVSVQDFGVGIAKGDQERIFDRFFQVRSLETGGGTYPGLGLGLYISAQIVRTHGGRIWVESEQGKGSTFYFTLPLARFWQNVE